MSKRWYGSVSNRIEEGHNYNEDKLIHEGDDITEYLWSDRHCYYVHKVIDQKHILVLPYYVCADHSKEGGIGHQNWLYFKTIKEERQYINDCIDKGLITGLEKESLENIKEPTPREWVYRYNHWYEVIKEEFGHKLDKPKYVRVDHISFGVRDYYYDWSF